MQSYNQHNQNAKKDIVFNKNRIKWVSITGGALYSISLFSLNELWYKNTPRSSFHFFNDRKEWQQVDKAGHFYTTFHMSRIGVEIFHWAANSPTILSQGEATDQLPITDYRTSEGLKGSGFSGVVDLGGASVGFFSMTPVEILDGFSSQYGASWMDLIANAAGSGFCLGQYLLWNELKIYPKYSFHKTSFSHIRPNMLGENLPEQMLKDYNGQIYWISVNIKSFFNNSIRFPPWLNVSFGYGADGMLGGFENKWFEDNKEIDYTNIPRYRQYYFSFDIDWMRIKTKSKFLKSMFYILNAFQIPAPALEFNAGKIAGSAKKRLNFQVIYFTI